MSGGVPGGLEELTERAALPGLCREDAETERGVLHPTGEPLREGERGDPNVPNDVREGQRRPAESTEQSHVRGQDRLYVLPPHLTRERIRSASCEVSEHPGGRNRGARQHRHVRRAESLDAARELRQQDSLHPVLELVERPRLGEQHPNEILSSSRREPVGRRDLLDLRGCRIEPSSLRGLYRVDGLHRVA